MPFRPYAEAGSVLERALYRAGISREALTITNLVWYRPPRNWLEASPWEKSSIDYCLNWNEDLIAARKPRVIVALGGLAMRELTGLSGEKQGIGMTRGFIVPGKASWTRETTWEDPKDLWGKDGEQVPSAWAGIPVIGSYHPSFLRRGSKEREEAGPRGKVAAIGGGTGGGMALLGVMIRDLQLAKEVSLRGAKKFEYDAYTLGGTLEEWRSAYTYLLVNPGLPVSYDFETQDSLVRESEEDAEHTIREVTQVQISWRVGQALVSAWTPELRQILGAILELPNPKLDWNGRKFDRLILRDMGIRTDLGEWHDLMDFWHHSQPDLPRGLQFATSFFCPESGPWKHFSRENPFYYGALDVDMPQRIWRDLGLSMKLQRNPQSGQSLWGDGRYSGYTGQVARLTPVLDAMTRRGIPVDEDRRHALDLQFSATLREQFALMQGMVPAEVKGVHVYKKTPSAETQTCNGCNGEKKVTTKGKERKCAECKGKGTVPVGPTLGASTTIKVGNGEKAREVPTTWTQTEEELEAKCGCWWSLAPKKQVNLLGGNCPKCSNTGKILTRALLWAKVEPFVPGSPQQVMGYVKHKREADIHDRAEKILSTPRGGKLEPTEAVVMAGRQTPWIIPLDYKSGKETTSEAELRRLAAKTGDPLLPLVLDYREIQKMKGTYVDGWRPGADGRVHPNFGFKPATGQLSSDSPNAQNLPQHSELAHVMKQMVRATDGKTMLKFDWKSFHAITAGFEARDKDFIRISRIDIHSFFTLVGILKLNQPEVAFAWGDDELRDVVKFYRKDPKLYPAYSRQKHPAGMTFDEIRDELAKRIVYGWEFGQGERSLFMLNPESFASAKEAGKFQAELKGLFGAVDKWQGAVRLQADQQHCLISRYGYVRRFWDVFQRRPVSGDYQPRNGDRVFEGKDGRRWLLKPGDDHESVVAFLPSNNAFGIKREFLVRLGEQGLDEKYGLICDVHDDARFECETRLVDEAVPTIKGLMTRPSEYLIDPVVAPEGLWCGVDAYRGADWDSLEKI